MNQRFTTKQTETGCDVAVLPPAAVVAAIQQVLDQYYEDESRDFDCSAGAQRGSHIIHALETLRAWALCPLATVMTREG